METSHTKLQKNNVSGSHHAVSSHNFFPKMYGFLTSQVSGNLSFPCGNLKKVGRFKLLIQVTDVGRGGNTIQVSKKQPTKE